MTPLVTLGEVSCCVRFATTWKGALEDISAAEVRASNCGLSGRMYATAVLARGGPSNFILVVGLFLVFWRLVCALVRRTFFSGGMLHAATLMWTRKNFGLLKGRYWWGNR